MSKQARSKKDRRVVLACEVCSQRNYSTGKSQKLKTERLEIKKYCPHCMDHTLHRETR